MKNEILTVFDRCGMAALSDLKSSVLIELLRVLENDQHQFLSEEARFRSPEYKWPRDPLHTWSRVWEYPYIYHHLRERFRGNRDRHAPRVVDLGSGATFFPFSVAKLGYHVVCLDIDRVCVDDLKKASECLSAVPGSVEPLLADECSIPQNDGAVDILYCISVLEHVTEISVTLKEISRVLRSGGIFLLTVDISLYRRGELSVESYSRLRHAVSEHFVPIYPEVTIHPRNLLLSHAGTYPNESRYGLMWLSRRFRERGLGIIPDYILDSPFVAQLGVMGLVLVKK